MLLVTGITGHTGSYFLKELIKNQYTGEIRCIVRKDSNTDMLDDSGLKVEKCVGDLNDEEFLEDCMVDVNEILHITNIRYTLKILKYAQKYNIRKIITVHTTGIFSKFRLASEEYKIIEEEIDRVVKKNGFNLTILRPTMIYGDMADRNISKFIRMIDKFRVFPIIDGGRSLLQPVNARDLGKAYYEVLMMPEDKRRCEYILSGEKPITVSEILKLISDHLRKRTIFVSVPLWLGLFIARVVKLLSFNKIDYVERVLRMSEDRSFAHNEAYEDFGYSCIPFNKGVSVEIEEYLKINRTY